MSEKNAQDQGLFQQIKEGNNTAFKTLFDRYYQKLLLVAINLLNDVNEAKDIVQEVFFQLWKKRATLTIPDYPAAYLKRSTVNAALSFIRSRKRVVEMPQHYDETSKEASANEVVEAEELEEVIQNALANLPERCRMIFVMKRIEGHSLKEIGRILEISPKTVENQITKALKILKEVVKPYIEE